jgi:glycosyltransferase involved in cell wall biosynthesis
MKILLVNNFFYPRVGGSSTVVAQLAENLSRNGHSVLVLTGQYLNAPIFEEKDGYKIYRLPTWVLPESKFTLNFDINFAIKLGNYRKLKLVIDDFKPDVIHCHGQFLDLTWKALKYAHRNNVPSILTLHTRLVNPGWFLNYLLYLLDKMIVKPIMILRSPTRVVIIDKTFKDYAKSRYGIAEEEMIYIPVGVDMEKFLGVEGEPSLGKSQKLILSVGHVIPVRNRLALVNALPAILKAHPDAKLRILGNVYQHDFLRVAKEIGVDHAIETPGAVPSSDIPKELSMAAIEIHDIQGYGISIASLEAMAMGVPCVMATDNDYFPHAPMKPGFHYIQVSPQNSLEISDAVIEALSDPVKTIEIGRHGSRYVREKFDIQDIVKKHEAGYISILNSQSLS